MLFFCFLITQVHAQKFMALTKPGIHTRIRYHAGDRVGFKLKGDKHIYKGDIQFFTDSAVAIGDSITVQLSDVRIFYDYDAGAAARYGSKILITAGIFYGAIVLINGSLANTNDLHNENNEIVTASLIGGGLLLLPFTKRKYKINHKRWLKIIDVSIAPTK